jgi:hypothetical protein
MIMTADRSATTRNRRLACALNRIVVMLGILAASVVWGRAPASEPDLSAVRQRIATLSVPFVPNAGQWDSRAAFGAQALGGMLLVTADGMLVYSQPGYPIVESAAPIESGERTGRRRQLAPPKRGPGSIVTETFIDAAGRLLLAQPRGTQPAAARVSYMIGNDAGTHQRELETFERIDLGDVFGGVNVQLRATGNNVEKIFTVAPHRDPRAIRLRVGGALRLEPGASGELIAYTAAGSVTFTAPIAFQEDDDGVRQPIGVRYAVDDDATSYRFALARYDASRTLVIDPLLQSTYHGAGGTDFPTAIAVHPATGDVYVAGFTDSPTNTFPGVEGGVQGSFGGGIYDAFVSRFNPDLTSLVRATYLGAAGGDQALALAIHPVSGDIYVAGQTNSATNTFPGLSVSSFQGTSGGSYDVFVSRLSADLGTLMRSTLLGSEGADAATAIAIHPLSGEVYVAGTTNQTPANTFPGVSGSPQQTSGGSIDGFVSRLSADLSTLLRSSYLGAAGNDEPAALAIHPATGDVYVAGQTNSTASTFPGVVVGVAGSAQSVHGGGTDGFVSRFSADLMQRLRSSYLGGTGLDRANALAIHPQTGEVYVAGLTTSASFPGMSPSSAQQGFAGSFDAFVSRFRPELGAVRSTYLGAGGNDQAFAMAIHPVSGEIYIAGMTESGFGTFPGTTGSAQQDFGGFQDAWVGRLSADLTALRRSTYLGGMVQDDARALAIDPASGNVYVAGTTTSTTGIPGTAGGAQPSGGGGTFDAFVSRFSLDLQAGDAVPSPFAFAAQTAVPTFSVRTSAPALITGLGMLTTAVATGGLGSSLCISSSNDCSCDATPGGTFTTAVVTIADGQYVCARHTSAPIPNALRQTVVVVGGGVAKFLTYTGNLFGNCSLDVDDSGTRDALTDGLIIIRALFGLTGSAVTNNATGAQAKRTSWEQIRSFLNGNCGTSFAQ